MHVTVGIGPPAALAHIDVGLPLVKAALLYSDHVTLCSPAASVLTRLCADDPSDLRARLATLAGLSADLGLDGAPARLGALLDAGRIDGDVAQIAVAGWWRHYRQLLAQTASASGLEALAPAVAAGRLVVDALGTGPVAHPADLMRAAADVYARHVSEAVSTGDTTPLLDAETAHGVGLAVASGRLAVSGPHRARARDSGLAAHVLQRLPLFEHATVPEVLDIRADLAAPLARFRAAAAEFAEAIASAAWDPDFEAEASRVYDRSVAPAVADIEDAVESVGYLRQLTARYAERPHQFVPVAAPLLTLAFSPAEVLAQTVVASLAGLSVAANAAHAWHADRDARRGIEGRRLFFVYAAGRRMDGRPVWR